MAGAELMSDKSDLQFMREAIALSKAGMERGDGGPFGCVIVKDGKVVGRGNNMVTSTNDPTAHAEVVAIREACRGLNDFQLTGCVLYTSCEPCPMCLGAIYWARPDRIVFAGNREDAADAGFDDQLIYDELPLPVEERRIPTATCLREEACEVFSAWKRMPDKTVY
jgi:guanine deaminase